MLFYVGGDKACQGRIVTIEKPAAGSRVLKVPLMLCELCCGRGSLRLQKGIGIG